MWRRSKAVEIPDVSERIRVLEEAAAHAELALTRLEAAIKKGTSTLVDLNKSIDRARTVNRGLK